MNSGFYQGYKPIAASDFAIGTKIISLEDIEKELLASNRRTYLSNFKIDTNINLTPQEIEETLLKFKKCLKPNGTLYMSLKESTTNEITEQIINERYFCYWTIEELNNVLKRVELKPIQDTNAIKTQDKKTTEQQQELWINAYTSVTPKINKIKKSNTHLNNI